MSYPDVVGELLQEVRAELVKAMEKHGPMNSNHEALAVIEEEVYEYRMQVYAGRKRRDRKEMRSELVQIAAMAIRALLDLPY